MKTMLSYTFWWIIPVLVCGVFYFIQDASLSNSESTPAVGLVQGITDNLISVNLFGISFILPALMANVIEKSGVDVDTANITKMPIVSFIIIMYIAIIAFSLYGMAFFIEDTYIMMILFTILMISYSCLSVFTVLVINLVCNSFISQAGAIGELTNVKHMISGSVNLTKKYGQIKEGFSPLLLVLLSFYVVFALLASYTGLKLIGINNYNEASKYIFTVPNLMMTIYYMITFCEDTFQALSANNQQLR